MARILGQEGASSRVSGIFSKAVLQAVVQAVLPFGSEIWVMNPHMVRDLGIFHHRVAQLIRGKETKKRVNRR